MHWALASSCVDPAILSPTFSNCPEANKQPGSQALQCSLAIGAQSNLAAHPGGGCPTEPEQHQAGTSPDHLPSLVQEQAPCIPGAEEGQAKQEAADPQVSGLLQHIELLKTQLSEATVGREHAEEQLKQEQLLAESIPRPVNGHISPQDWDKMQLRLRKAERALEQERSHVDSMRQQLDAQRDFAAVGAQASTTIHCLRSELALCQALAAQRTSEAEALQRALRLSDETVARLRAQLTGLLEANQVAMAREQDLERQIQQLHQVLERQSAQAAESLMAAQQQGQGSYRAIQAQAAKLQQEHTKLTARVAEQAAALTAAKAECARKDAGIRALESVLSQHGRQRPETAQAAQNAAVAIDMDRAAGQEAGLAAGTRTPGTAELSLPGGLTDSQWKLVMLSEEVRRLRSTVQQLRQQAQAAPTHQRVLPQPSLPPVRTGARQSESDDGREVLEVDLPPEEVRARVAHLAHLRLQLEEELQALTQGSNGIGDGGGPAGNGTVHPAGMDSTAAQQAEHHNHALSVGVGPPSVASELQGRLQAHVRAQDGAGGAQGTPGGGQAAQGQQDAVRAIRKKPQRRGWWGWLLGAQDDVSLV